MFVDCSSVNIQFWLLSRTYRGELNHVIFHYTAFKGWLSRFGILLDYLNKWWNVLSCLFQGAAPSDDTHFWGSNTSCVRFYWGPSGCSCMQYQSLLVLATRWLTFRGTAKSGLRGQIDFHIPSWRLHFLAIPYIPLNIWVCSVTQCK